VGRGSRDRHAAGLRRPSRRSGPGGSARRQDLFGGSRGRAVRHHGCTGPDICSRKFVPRGHPAGLRSDRGCTGAVAVALAYAIEVAYAVSLIITVSLEFAVRLSLAVNLSLAVPLGCAVPLEFAVALALAVALRRNGHEAAPLAGPVGGG
jgi:hypothetical protein